VAEVKEVLSTPAISFSAIIYHHYGRAAPRRCHDADAITPSRRHYHDIDAGVRFIIAPTIVFIFHLLITTISPPF